MITWGNNCSLLIFSAVSIDNKKIIEPSEHKYFMFNEAIYGYEVEMNPNLMDKRYLLDNTRRYLFNCLNSKEIAQL